MGLIDTIARPRAKKAVEPAVPAVLPLDQILRGDCIEHMKALREHGPTPIHRRSFAPVAAAYLAREGLFAQETTS